MRHVISILLQNEAGALARVASLFSTRGYNIESLSVAPTEDLQVSRLTLVSIGSDQVISQITQQLFKLVDVVNIADMTLGDHFERELAILKVKLASSGVSKAKAIAKKHGAEILDDSPVSFTLQLMGRVREIDVFIEDVSAIGELSAVARSGSVAVSKGEVTLSSYDAHHHLSA